MKNSKIFTINWKDAGRGLLIAFLTALLGGIIERLQAGELPVTWVAFQPILEISLSAGLAYLLNALLTNSKGDLLKNEAGQRVLRFGKAKFILLPALLLLTASVSAQSPFKGFFEPVTVEKIQSFAPGEKALSGTFLIRPEMTIAGNVLKPKFNEAGQYDGFESSFATRVGLGASWSLYKVIDSQPVNVYSFAALLSMATIEKPNMGLLVTASAFNLYGLSPSVGLGYDFVKDSPFKANYYMMWGISHTF